MGGCGVSGVLGEGDGLVSFGGSDVEEAGGGFFVLGEILEEVGEVFFEDGGDLWF